jgi:hypothetical protein
MDKKSEVELLIRCLREEETSVKKERLRSIAGHQWEAACQTSLDFGLAPLLYSTLRPLTKGIGLPAGVESRLREVYLSSAARNVRLYSELARVLKALKDADIPVIPLKGSYLAGVVYGDAALRPMNDIDLMVRQEDFRKTIELLMSREYRAEGKARPEDVFAVQQHHPPLTGRSGIPIEVHWTITQPKLNSLIMPPHPALSREGRENNVIPQHAAGHHWIAEGIWHRARHDMVANVKVPVLSPEDLIIHLCIHAVQHHRLEGQLRSLFDIARTIRFYADDIDWPLMRDLARLWGAERSVYLALALAGRYAGISGPGCFMTDIGPKNNTPEIFEIAETFLFNRSFIISRHVAKLWEQKGLIHKCRYLLGRFFLPRIEIAVCYGVPSNSMKVYLYYLMRWRDIVRRHLRTVAKVLCREQGATKDLEISIRQNILLSWLSNEKR